MSKNQNKTFFLGILAVLSLAHGLNDAIQSIISAIYPLLKINLDLSYGEIGMITFVYQLSSSLLQPLFGYAFDKRPAGWFLPIGLCCTMLGIVLIAYGDNVYQIMGAVFFSGIGSSIMHPEASRITSLAAGSRKGLAQSIFQVGGSCGYSFGPLLAALFVREQSAVAKFGLLAIVAIVALIPACRWYSKRLKTEKAALKKESDAAHKKPMLPRKIIWITMSILIFLVFSKNFYTVSISNYYTFYLINKFGVSIQTAQILLFAFLFAAAIGTFAGGPIGDKYGRRLVIWWSILGSAPFALMMPYANFTWTIILSMTVGFIISSAFSAMLVYAQELLPLKVGLVSGMFFGFAFGFAGVASAILGVVADRYGIDFVYHVCAFLPLFGAVAYFLPKVRTLQSLKNESESDENPSHP